MSRKHDKHTDPAAPENTAPGTDVPATEMGVVGTGAAESNVVDSAVTEASIEDLVERLEGEVAELKNQLLRALAETENLRRRSAREREDAVKYAAVPLIKDIIGVADNLRRALGSVPEDAIEGNEQLKTLLDGVGMTEKELQSVFAGHGIERIEPMGGRLDPHFHEALFEVPDTSVPAGTVVRVLQAGYRLGERLIRPAQVGVAKGGPSAATASADDTGGNGGSEGNDRQEPGSQYDTSA
ncbi:MAG: nucleotide exchange factor GrpE [Alphaproteobacteria bacterium]